jgi:hypothetical protein
MLTIDSEESCGSHKIMVTPVLRPFDELQFGDLSEFVEFFTQLSKLSPTVAPGYLLGKRMR